MPMNAEAKVWLVKVAGGAAKKEVADRRQEARGAVLAQVAQQMEAMATQIRDGFTFEVTDGSATQRSIDEGGDQAAEFDADETRDGFGLVQGRRIENDAARAAANVDLAARLRNVRSSEERVAALKAVLEQEVDVVDDDGNPVMEDVQERHPPDSDPPTFRTVQKPKKQPMFSPAEVSEELYTPLVRQRAMPDTAVPNQYSRTQQMLDGTMTAYRQRVQEESRVPEEGFLRSMARGDHWLTSVMKTGLSLTPLNDLPTEGLGGVGDGDSFRGAAAPWADAWNNTADSEETAAGIVDVVSGRGAGARAPVQITGMMEAVDVLMGTGSRVADAAAAPGTPEARLGQVKPRVECLVALLGNTLSGEVGKIAPGIANAVRAIYISSADTGGIAAAFAARPEPDAAAVVAKLGKAFADAMSALDPDAAAPAPAAPPGAAPAPPPAPNPFPKLGNAIKTAFAVPADGLKAAILEGDARNDYNKAMELLAKAGKSAVKSSLSAAPDFGPAARNGEAMVRQKAAAEQEREFTALMGADEQEERAELQRIEGEQDRGRQATMIEKQIKELKNHMSTVDAAAKIMSGGMEAASKFLAPLAAAGCAVKMVANIAKAVQRSRDLTMWLDQKEAMLIAVSPYSDAARNFVGNQERQRAWYAIQAALEFTKMAASVIECSGIGTAVGRTVNAAADATQTIIGLIAEVKKKMDVASAWKVYKKALSRPENRKLGLLAIRQNPTLAKYAIAFGAYEKQDPLAKAAVAACGLDERALEQEGANLGQVVSYLEARFADDNTVAGGAGNMNLDGLAVTLDPTSWLKIKLRAQKKGKLKPASTAVIEAGLVNAVRVSGRLTEQASGAGRKPFTIKTDCKPSLDELEELLGALLSYAPQDTDGRMHPDMKGIANEFTALVRAKIAEVKAVESALPAVAPPAAPPQPGGGGAAAAPAPPPTPPPTGRARSGGPTPPPTPASPGPAPTPQPGPATRARSGGTPPPPPPTPGATPATPTRGRSGTATPPPASGASSVSPATPPPTPPPTPPRGRRGSNP